MKIFTNSKEQKNKQKQFRFTTKNANTLNYLSDVTKRSETDVMNDLLAGEGEKLKIVDKIDKILGIYLSKQNPKTNEKYDEEEFAEMENKLIAESREQNKTCEVKNILSLFVGYSTEPNPTDAWGVINCIHREDVLLNIRCSALANQRYSMMINRRFVKFDPNNKPVGNPMYCNAYFELKDKFALINILEKFTWEYDNIDVSEGNNKK